MNSLKIRNLAKERIFVCLSSALLIFDLSVYITKFCSMIELLHELKTAVFNIEAFRHFIMSQQRKKKTKFSGLLHITKN